MNKEVSVYTGLVLSQGNLANLKNKVLLFFDQCDICVQRTQSQIKLLENSFNLVDEAYVCKEFFLHHIF